MRLPAFIVVSALPVVCAAGAFGASCVSSDHNGAPGGIDGSVDVGNDGAPPMDATNLTPADAGADSPTSGDDAGSSPDSPTGASTAIASNLGTSIYGLTASGGYLFWLSQTAKTISRCEATSCQATLTVLYTNAFVIRAIAVDATNVYFTDDESTFDSKLQSIPIDSDGGVAAVTLASGLGDPYGIAATDPTNLYVAELATGGPMGGSVTRCARANCMGTLASIPLQGTVSSLAANANTVYWAGAGNPNSAGFVRSAPSAFVGDGGTAPTPFANQPAATSLAIDTTNVYFVGYPQGSASAAYVWFCPLGGCPDGGATQLSTSETGLDLDYLSTWEVSDGAHVYFAEGDGLTIGECPVAGCNGAATTLTTLSAVVSTTSITLDASYVYILGSGSIYRITR